MRTGLRGILFLAVAVLLAGPFSGVVRAQEAVSFDRAMELIAQEVKARQGQGTGPQISRRTKKKEGQVKFKLELGPDGRSRVTTSKNTFGVTLRCRAQILSPEGSYDVRVGTNAGSSHDFAQVTANREVSFELKTKGGLSATEFFVELNSIGPPQGAEALVTMTYLY